MNEFVDVCLGKAGSKSKPTKAIGKNENIATFRDEDDGVMKNDGKRKWLRNKYLYLACGFVVLLIIMIAAISSSGSGNKSSSPITGGAVPQGPSNPTGEPLDDPDFDPDQDGADYAIIAEFYGPVQNNLEGGFAEHLTISYDGQRIAASAPSSGSRGYGAEIYQHDTIDFTWEKIAVVHATESEGSHSGDEHNFMSFSRDGKHIVLTQDDEVHAFVRGTGPMGGPNGGFEQLGQDFESGFKSSVANNRIHFGQRHAMSQNGDFLAILSTTSTGSAQVRIYHDNPSVSKNDKTFKWHTVRDDLDLGDVEAVDMAISANGETLVIGIVDATNSDGMQFAGMVQAFSFEPNGNVYTPMGDPIYGTKAQELFGGKVDIADDGKTFAVAPQGGGFVEVYTWDVETQEWLKKGDRLTGDPNIPEDGFGLSFALDVEGHFLVVGAPGNTDRRRFHYGNIRLYSYNPTSGRWKHRGMAQSGYRGDGFGLSVDMSTQGNRIVVGAPYRNWDGVERVGAFRIYRAEELTYGI